MPRNRLTPFTCAPRTFPDRVSAMTVAWVEMFVSVIQCASMSEYTAVADRNYSGQGQGNPAPTVVGGTAPLMRWATALRQVTGDWFNELPLLRVKGLPGSHL